MTEINHALLIKDPEAYILEASITMQDIRRSDKDTLYVVNTSDFNGQMQRGEIGLKYTSEDTGKDERHPIADSWIPIDITQYQEKSKWVKSKGLNDLVAKGFLTIVDPDVAEAILATPEAKDELRRLREKTMRMAPHLAKARQQTNKATAEAREKYKAIDDVKKINLNAAEEGLKVSPRVMAIMQNTSTDETQKLASLKNAKSGITPGDINFIMTNCGKSLPRIKSWAIDFKNNIG